MRTTISIFIIATLVTGCSLLRKSTNRLLETLHLVEHVELKPPPKEAPEAYKQAVGLLEDSKFAEALDAFDAFVKDEPTSPYTQAAILNSGRSLEGLSRWSEASERFRAVVRATINAPKLQAMALYRTSFCHEAVGEDQKVVATLSDLLKRVSDLPPEMAQAELPARLAAAYARVGNFDRALDFYRQAESGIAKLRQESEDDVPEWLPRTLFFMGELSRRAMTWDEFETALRPLARGQVYLLQAAELSAAPWSDRASNELVTTYSNLWNAIATAPLSEEGDPLLAKRALQVKQWNRAILLLDTIAELRARFLPTEAANRSEPAKRILTMCGDIENKISLLLLERPAGEGLTREALVRKQGIRGRVVAPSDALERRFIEKVREVPAIKKIKKQPERTKTLPKKKGNQGLKLQMLPSPTPQPALAAEPSPTSTPAQIRPVPAPTAPVEDPNL